MPSLFRLIPLLALLGGSVLQSQAATVLVNAATLNGSFETGTSTTVFNNWVAPSGGALQRQNNMASDGGWSLVVGMSAVNVPVGAVLDTGYALVTGDVFSLSFDVRGAFQAETTDEVNWTLFYTSDNSLSGTQTVLFSGTQAVGGSTFISTGLLTTGSIGGAASGKTLFFSITAGSGFTSDEYSRVDNVALSVTSVPEPAGFGVLASATPFFFFRRRALRRV
ncbi:MAG: hypothetical protein QM755_07110 [Luteolibacter sp.]